MPGRDTLNELPPVAAQVRRLPNEPGVYRFRDEAGSILYIGRATTLRSRVGSYWTNLGDRRHLRRMVPLIARVEAVVCDSVHEAAWLERNLLEYRKPRWNRVRGGLEVPVHIAFETRGREPRLTVNHDHDGESSFGPYLGGVRTRLAVAALNRIYPLAYTANRMSGSERDMAARRGVGPEDREPFMASIAAVLRRDETAVALAMERLVQLRHDAATAEAFERAGAIQSEIEALQWVAGTQRVTVHGGGDHTIAGWSDGLLTQFVVRGGRLCQWTTRACTERAANARVESTAGEWRSFAGRSAELAASIGMPILSS